MRRAALVFVLAFFVFPGWAQAPAKDEEIKPRSSSAVAERSPGSVAGNPTAPLSVAPNTYPRISQAIELTHSAH